jgi:transposase
MAAIVVDPGAFRSGCDFAAALGLVPRQASLAPRADLRGRPGAGSRRQAQARSDQQARQWLSPPAAGQRRDGGPHQPARQDPWLGRLLAKKPRKLVACALANKMARIA